MIGNSVLDAIRIARTGGIIVFPTDTAYGIGCRIDDDIALQKLFAIRKRPLQKPPPVLVNSPEMVEKYVGKIQDDIEKRLIDRYWPGALTIVMSVNPKNVSSYIRGYNDGVGFRAPDHHVPLQIINGLGVPIVGTSANFHGDPTPYSFKDLDKELLNLVDYVYKGTCMQKMESTVIDCTRIPWEILRKGAIDISL
ncbi:MAG: threonylcarbamoyl-AMP synthase [Candidatus Levybacteria bacterium]|nr:threonylcarbamoyl-AMP synthase [Candidatus Levybacteria bacterium]